MDTVWDYDRFWNKCKVYVERGLNEDRTGPLFAFWLALTLEHLGRATLAKIHPALLADPGEGGNIMYAFGYPVKTDPKSIPAKTVFVRCQIIVADFTEDDGKFCMTIINRRNEELHSGSTAFEDLPTALWMTPFFRVCKILLISQGKTLSDLFDETEAHAAEEMIEAADKTIKSNIEKQIGTSKSKFLAFTKKEQAQKKAAGLTQAEANTGRNGKLAVCPACGAQASLQGKTIKLGGERLEDDLIHQETVILPTTFHCYSCDLHLDDHGALNAAGLGGQFNRVNKYDPMDFYSSQMDPADFYEEDYGND
jgi:hypothetical protein